MIKLIARNQSYMMLSSDHRVIRAIKEFSKAFIQVDFKYDYKTRKTIKVLKYSYTAGNRLGDEFILNKNNINRFIGQLKSAGVNPGEIILTHDEYKATKIVLFFKDVKIPREYQEKYNIELVKEDDGEHAKLVDLYTGYGKSYIAMRAMSIISERVIMLLLPKYIKKWAIDIPAYFDTEPGDILTVSGREEVISLLSKPKGEVKAKFILIANRTFSNFIHEYEAAPVPDMFNSPVLPKDICRHLDVGVVVVDEVHNEVYSIFKAMMYLDPRKFIGLSATFLAKDKTLKFIQESMFNSNSRLSLVAYTPYIIAHSVQYRLHKPKRYNGQAKGNRGYSHIEFENRIKLNRHTLDGYLRMISYQLDEFYINLMKKGEKAVVFCSSIEMCTIVTSYLSELYNHLDVKRYVGDDDDANLYDSDIRVTTIKSGGEAVDIADLICGILTVSIDSEIANMQALGRLREIPGRDVNYVWLWCADIEAHKKYYYNKIKLFNGKVKQHNHTYYNDDVDKLYT